MGFDFISSQTTANGVLERRFTLDHTDDHAPGQTPGDPLPGVLWSPAGASGPRPLVLLGHGGGQHKQDPRLVARAHHYVTEHGFAVAAVDAPWHGDRPVTEEGRQLTSGIRDRVAAGEPLAPLMASYNALMAARAVPEWRAVLDALRLLDCVGPDGPVGYWGVSMGSGIGLPLVAAEPRITAAVLGLAGFAALAGTAARITVPVEFLLQWDDEMVPREAGLALFDALGSAEKSLHANPGRHVEVPAHELESSARFFARHLRPAPGRGAGPVR
jgi:dienelactone hydrolase